MKYQSTLSRLLSASKGKHGAGVLADSTFFTEREYVDTGIPAMNIAFSGDVRQGFYEHGLTTFAADSKHYKTNFALHMVAAYLRKYDDGVCLFFDSEFGAPPDYFKSAGVDPSRVAHIPITSIEELRTECANQLEALKPEEHVIILVDSVGNLASKKEVADALEGSEKADMTRAKTLKSFYRIVTPYLEIKRVPMVVVNHVYTEQTGMYPKEIMSGGKGGMLAANTVFFISKAKHKEGDELDGFRFTLISEKSRFVREQARIPITVSYTHGIDKWSGMLDIAKDLGCLKNNGAWYYGVNKEGIAVTEKVQRKNMDDAFWNKLLDAGLDTAIRQYYRLPEDEVAARLQNEADASKIDE